MGLFRSAIKKLLVYIKLLVALLFRAFFKIKKGRVLFWSTVGKDYSCNPLYISQYILNNETQLFDVYWLFRDNVRLSVVDSRVKTVKYGTLRHLFLMETSEYLITNHRTSKEGMLWLKRPEQKYIMTWHGSMPLKKIEKDALDSLGQTYEKYAKTDSDNCSLMISDSKWFSDLLRKSFWYNGEILEEGMPRNDIFYAKKEHEGIKEKVAKALHISNPSNKLLILYAPTFRTDHKTDKYILHWKGIKESLEENLKKEIVILLRLHPTLLNIVDTSKLISEEYVKNASEYSNMQELMVTSDILITDYSSTMFEFTLLNKPSFLYVPDIEKYDRGFYFKVNELPFPVAYSENELICNLISYDAQIYKSQVDKFMNSTFGVKGDGHACEKVVQWMKDNLI